MAVIVSLAKSAWYWKLYQARAGIIVSGVSLLLSLGAVELSIRIVDPLGISYYEVSGEYTRDKLADDHLHLPAQTVLVKFQQRYQFGYRIPAKPLMTLIS